MEQNNPKPAHGAWSGIFLIVGGLLYLAYKMKAPIPDWVFTPGMALIAVGFLVGIKHRFRNFSWAFLIGIGALLLADKLSPDLQLHDYLGPLIIIMIGVMFLLRSRRGSKHPEEWRQKWDWKNFANNPGAAEDFIDATCIFSGVNKVILSKDFKGGDITCIFGGAEIDFTKADLQGPAVLDLTEIFGGTKLIVPPHWVVKNQVSVFFAGIDDKRTASATGTDTSKVLVLTGTCIFAGIEIKSY